VINDLIPNITVNLDLPARDRWLEPGLNIAPLVQELADSALEVAGKILPPFFRPLFKRSRSFLIPNPLCRVISKEMTDEAIGLSKATGVPVSHIVLSNCTYDFTQLCSAAVYLDSKKRPVMIRYMDWDLPEDIAKYTVQVDYVREGVPAYSSVGFAGFLGVVTAFSTKWALAMNQAPSEHLRISHPIKKTSLLSATPTTYAMRQLCDGATSYTSLKQGLKKVDSMTPFLALVCGSKSGQVARIERPSREAAAVTVIRNGEVLSLTNHYLNKNHLYLNDEGEWESEDGEIWSSDSSKDRLCKVEELANSFSNSVNLPPMAKLKRKPVFWDLTVHTAVMRPATGECRFANHHRKDLSA
jgi:hypothetical protein